MACLRYPNSEKIILMPEILIVSGKYYSKDEFDSFFALFVFLQMTIADLFIDFMTNCPHPVVIKLPGKLL